MDFAKLSRLVKASKESGVKLLTISGEEVRVEYFADYEAPIDAGRVVLEGNPEKYTDWPKFSEKIAAEINESSAEATNDDDDMLHLSDPVAWEAKLRGETDTITRAAGGDEEEGHYDV